MFFSNLVWKLGASINVVEFQVSDCTFHVHDLACAYGLSQIAHFMRQSALLMFMF
uniref:Uncharacterized protein n=1 Tax=Arundo donax TaxID=35708 RepID=A0A0A8XZN4_ARUDO